MVLPLNILKTCNITLPPSNPSTIVLSIQRTTLSPSYLKGLFSSLDKGLPASSCPQELDLHDPQYKSPLTQFLRCPSQIRHSISFLSWQHSSMWCPLTLWNLHHLPNSSPITLSFRVGVAGILNKWRTSRQMCSRRVLRGMKLSIVFLLP